MRTVSLLLVAVALAACKSHNGIYMPDCIAYEGDTVELHDGRFEWDRFTDQVLVDDGGKVVDPFPDYPKAGSYAATDTDLKLTADDGSALPDMRLVEDQGKIFLLTAAQYRDWQSGSPVADCALVRQ